LFSPLAAMRSGARLARKAAHCHQGRARQHSARARQSRAGAGIRNAVCARSGRARSRPLCEHVCETSARWTMRRRPSAIRKLLDLGHERGIIPLRRWSTRGLSAGPKSPGEDKSGPVQASLRGQCGQALITLVLRSFCSGPNSACQQSSQIPRSFPQILLILSQDAPMQNSRRIPACSLSQFLNSFSPRPTRRS